MNKQEKQQEKHISYGLVFFVVVLIFSSITPAFIITTEKNISIVALVEQIIGVFLISIYLISGGFLKWQNKELVVWKKFVKWFGQTAQPGMVLYILFTSIGLGMVISGLLLELYVYIISV